MVMRRDGTNAGGMGAAGGSAGGRLTAERIRRLLEEAADAGSAAFSKSLGIGARLPVLGVPVPRLRAIGRELAREDGWREALCGESALSDGTFEEVLLRAFIIGCADMDTGRRLALLKDYIPLVSDWALCDCAVTALRFKPCDYGMAWGFAAELLRSRREFEVRFGAVLTLSRLKSRERLGEQLEALSRADTSGFYAMTGVAWACAELFKLDSGRVLGFLSRRSLDLRTTRKALSKICDSRTTPDACRTKIKELRKSLK